MKKEGWLMFVQWWFPFSQKLHKDWRHMLVYYIIHGGDVLKVVTLEEDLAHIVALELRL